MLSGSLNLQKIGQTTRMSEEYEFALVKSVPLAPPSENLRPFMERKFRTLFRYLKYDY